jgi:hypothetical protein
MAASELFRTGTEDDHIRRRFHASKYGCSGQCGSTRTSGLFEEML